MRSGIYLIECSRPNDAPLVYVGQALDMRVRWAEHRRDLRRGEHRNPRIQSAWRKYGEKAFLFHALLPCDVSHLDDLEQGAIDALIDSGRCMNIARFVGAPQRGRPISAEAKLKISAANRGRRRTEEFRVLMSEHAKRRQYSAETRAKMSASHAGHRRPEHVREAIKLKLTGRSVPAEQRVAMSAAAKTRPLEDERREVLRRNSLSMAMAVEGTCLRTAATVMFHSLGATAAAGFQPQNVGKVANGRARSHRGYSWRFL